MIMMPVLILILMRITGLHHDHDIIVGLDVGDNLLECIMIVMPVLVLMLVMISGMHHDCDTSVGLYVSDDHWVASLS